MTKEDVERYQKLRGDLEQQAELILSVFHPLDGHEQFTKVEFSDYANFGPQIHIWFSGYSYGEDYKEFYNCPKSYLYMTKEELVAEKSRLDEEERRKREEAKKKEESRRQQQNKKARYKKYLELKKEFEGTEGTSI